MARSPLFDIYDPYGILQQQAEMGMLPGDDDIEPYGMVPMGRKATLSDLMPEEEKTGLLRSLANMGASGLTGLGWVLDTPGSMVRGLLSDGPSKALSALWESSDERVSGRDLMRQYGMVGEEDTWQNFAGGVAGEILLDPLTYLNPLAVLGRGALGTAGRTLNRAGLLDNAALMANKQGMGVREFLRQPARKIMSSPGARPDAFQDFATAARGKGLDVDELLDMPAAGLAEFRLPFTEQGVMLGTGKIGDWAAKNVDAFGEFLKANPATGPIVNRATAAFDPTVMGEIDPNKQWRNREAWDQATQNERDFREWLTERVRQADKVNNDRFKFGDQRIQNAIRDTIEARLDPERIAALQDQEAVSALESVTEWKAYRDDLVDKLGEFRQRRVDLGLEAPDAKSLEGTGFFPSQSIWFNSPQSPKLPDRIGRQQKAYNRGPRVLSTDELVGRSRDPKTDIARRSETFRRLMAGDFGRKLQDDLIKAGDDDVPVLIDRAFQELGIDSPFGNVRVDGLSMEAVDARRSLADSAEELLAGWASSPQVSVLRAKPEELGSALDAIAKNAGLSDTLSSLPQKEQNLIRAMLRRPESIEAARKQAAAASRAVELSERAKELLANWKTAPSGDVAKASLDNFGPLLDEMAGVLGVNGNFSSMGRDDLAVLRKMLRSPRTMQSAPSLAARSARRAQLASQAEKLLPQVSLMDAARGSKLDGLGGALDQVAASLNLDKSFSSMSPQELRQIKKFLRKPGGIDSARKQLADAEAAINTQQNTLKTELGDTLRRADRQFSPAGIGLFDQSTVNDMLRYGVGQARSEANASVILDDLLNNLSALPPGTAPGGGQKRLLDVAPDLGLNRSSLTEVLRRRLGPDVDVANLTINEKVVDNLRRLAPGQIRPEPGPLGKLWDSYTNAFKIGSLANPSYHTRNLYSGFLSTLMGGTGNVFDNAINSYVGWQAGRGSYKPLAQRLKKTERYAALPEDEAVDLFLAEAGRNRLAGGFVEDVAGVAEQRPQALYPGANRPETIPWIGERGLLYDPNRSWQDWLTVRGVDFGGVLGDRPAPSETLNPWLNLHERTGMRVEDANRLGAYLSELQAGASPDAAARRVFESQVDYSPRAFTEFERQLKRLIPFYSYTRGIAPSVASNVLYRPGGVQGQTIRAISRASEPNEDFFVPEHLRQSAAIPLPGMEPADGVQRMLSKIDLPYAGLLNLFSPGVGNTASDRAVDSFQKTGMNLLGMLNPLVKAPLELALDRQLYSGRELSELYSSFENAVPPEWGPLARVAEQLFVNLPGGSRINSIARTAFDERLSPLERAGKVSFNNTTGLAVTDIDQARQREKAARQMLNELLSSTPGVRTYENITVPEDVLRAMPREQQQMYLLYRIIQSEAAKRARERKKQELDPMQLLGVVNQFGA
jgi:hypothetical protein